MDNYYALAASILADISVDKALRKMGLQSEDKITSHAHRRKIDRDRKVIELSKVISSNKEIAELMGVSPTVICKILTENGIYRRGRGHDGRRKGIFY
jgi:DNA-directed RNA polymerase specialized sigma subunit